MPLCDDISAERTAILAIDTRLEALELRLASRNTAHKVTRARSMLRSTAIILAEALSHSTEECPSWAELGAAGRQPAASAR